MNRGWGMNQVKGLKFLSRLFVVILQLFFQYSPPAFEKNLKLKRPSVYSQVLSGIRIKSGGVVF